MHTSPQPVIRDEPAGTADVIGLLEDARRALGVIGAAYPDLMARSAAGDGGAVALLSALPVLRRFVNRVTPAWFAACADAEVRAQDRDAEITALRAQLETARRSGRARHARRNPGRRPLLNVVRDAGPR